MVATSYTLIEILPDSAPLIYLAKLEALECFEAAGYRARIAPAVIEETSRPELAYRHADALAIREALKVGVLMPVELATRELVAAERLREEVPGLGQGERQVLAIARSRRWPALLHDRRAAAIGRAFGVSTIDIVELLFRATTDDRDIETRLRRYAEMVEMRLTDREMLIERLRRG